MGILVTGADGLIGATLVKQLKSLNFDVKGYSKQELDVTSFLNCQDVIFKDIPDLIIHCAAIISADASELNPEKTHLINVKGTENIAFCCRFVNIPLFYFSSCAVFDGYKNTPYVTSDKTNPIYAYGRSKVEAENIVRELDNFYILRSSCVYGKIRPDFITLTIDKFRNEKKPDFPIVDQIINIIEVNVLCKIALNLIFNKRYGLHHCGTRGEASRKEIVLFIAELFNKTEFTFSEFKLSDVLRPKYSVLDLNEIQKLINYPIPHWKDALKKFVEDYA